MNGELLNSKQMKILIPLLFLMGIISLASYAVLNFEKVDFLNPTPARISVVGEGEVLAAPTIQEFSFSVTASGKTAPEAQEASGVKINEIVAYLKEQGIEDKDIKTQNVNLYPKFRYEQKICPLNTYCQGEQVPDGYEASQSVAVKVRNIEKSGELVAGIGERGATNIGDLKSTIDNIEAVRAEARKKAIEDAKAKMTVLTGQLGVRVVRLTSYVEEGGSYYPPYYESKAGLASADVAGFAGATMPVGEESTKVRVNVTYEVK